MSNQNINVSSQNVQGKCDLKCAYNFNYSEGNLTAINRGVLINLTYDNNGATPVTYNNEKYIVSTIYIACPSIHMFDGSQAAAEMIINHNPVAGGPQLNVSIPFTSSTESSTASNLVTEIIQSVATNAPSQSNSTNLNISGFTLQKIVPNKPFFSYTDNGNNEWIVFGILYAIPLSSSTINTLSQIIKPWPIPTQGGSLFYNSSGPNSSGYGIGGDLYISCQPTGSSEELEPVEYAKNTPSYDFSNMLQSPLVATIIQVVIGCIIFILVFATISYLFTKGTSSTIKLPTIQTLTKNV